jgi:hypothetical protein
VQEEGKIKRNKTNRFWNQTKASIALEREKERATVEQKTMKQELIGVKLPEMQKPIEMAS